MKYVVNAITISRMLLSVLLLFLLDNRAAAFAVFILCGLSDVADGFIARRTGTKSTVGAKLDAAADLFMFGIITICLFIWSGEELKGLLPYLAAVVAIRLANMVIAAFKYHTFAIIHTWGNKITGIMVFVTFAAFILYDNAVIFLPLSFIAILSALEETVIHITSGKLDLNRPSIFKKGRL